MMRYASLVLAAAIFGFMAVLIHWNALMFGDVFQVFIRNAGALLLLIPIILYKQISFTLSKYDLWLLLAYSLLVGISFVAITLAFIHTDVKHVLAVRYTTTVVCAFILSAFVLKETINSVQIYTLALVALGIVIFSYPFTDVLSIGSGYACLYAVSFVGSSFIIKQTTMNAYVVLFTEFLAVTILLGLYILVFQPTTIIEYNTLGIIGAVIFTISILAVTTLLIYGFRKTNFSIANIILTSEIFFSLVFGYFLLHQSITTVEFIGILLIAAALVVPHCISLLQHKQ